MNKMEFLNNLFEIIYCTYWAYIGIKTFKFSIGIISPFIKIKNIEKIKNKILYSDEIDKVKQDSLNIRCENDKKIKIDTKYKEDLFYYKEILIDNATFDQQKIINANYKDLDLNDKKTLAMRLRGVPGSYNIKDNKIVIENKNPTSHETIHMSNSCYSEKYKAAISGFHQYRLTRYGRVKFQIARGLNEACTNIKDSRTFKSNIFKSYKDQTIVVLLLERIIGNKVDVQEDFENMDLGHLLQRYKAKGMEDEILEIIILLDATLDSNIILVRPMLFNNIIKRLIALFRTTNPTEEEEKKFFNIISKNNYMKKYVQKKSLYNYTDEQEEKTKKYQI